MTATSDLAAAVAPSGSAAATSMRKSSGRAGRAGQASRGPPGEVPHVVRHDHVAAACEREQDVERPRGTNTFASTSALTGRLTRGTSGNPTPRRSCRRGPPRRRPRASRRGRQCAPPGTRAPSSLPEPVSRAIVRGKVPTIRAARPVVSRASASPRGRRPRRAPAGTPSARRSKPRRPPCCPRWSPPVPSSLPCRLPRIVMSVLF